MTTQISDLLGSWHFGSSSVTFRYVDETTVRMDNSLGQTAHMSAAEAQARIDGLRDAGWHR